MCTASAGTVYFIIYCHYSLNILKLRNIALLSLLLLAIGRVTLFIFEDLDDDH